VFDIDSDIRLWKGTFKEITKNNHMENLIAINLTFYSILMVAHPFENSDPL